MTTTDVVEVGRDSYLVAEGLDWGRILDFASVLIAAVVAAAAAAAAVRLGLLTVLSSVVFEDRDCS